MPSEPVFGEALSFRVVIDVGFASAEDAVPVPLGFRYNLFGDPSTTEVLNPSAPLPKKAARVDQGGPWRRVYAPGDEPAPTPARSEAGDGDEAASPPATANTTPTKADAVAEEDEGQPLLFRWERSHRIEAVDDAFVLLLNREPLMPVFLFRDATTSAGTPSKAVATAPTPEAVVVKPSSKPGSRAPSRPVSAAPKPAPATADSTPTKKNGGGSPGGGAVSHYCHATVLDLSPLLAGDVSVGRTFGAHPTATALADAADPSGGDNAADAETGSVVGSVASAAPSKARSVARSGGSEASSVAGRSRAAPLPPWLSDILCRAPGCSFPAPKGVAYVRMTVVVDAGGRAMLSGAELHRLNPLSVTVCSVRDLPGVRVESKALEKHVATGPFALQRAHCRPTYVVVQPIVGDLGPRLVATEGQVAGGDVTFNQTTTFLTGGHVVSRHVLEEAVANVPLRVEVHDRDHLEGHDEQLARCERLVKGDEAYDGPDLGLDEFLALRVPPEEKPDPSEPPSEPTSRPPSRGGKEEVAAASAAVAAALMASNGPAPAKGSMSVFLADRVWLAETIARWKGAGDHHAHGTATFKLDGLLNQAKSLAAAFNRTAKKGAGGKRRKGERPPEVELKMRAAVLPTKRRVIPKGGEDDWALSEGERLVRKPGQYLATDASIRVTARLRRPFRALEEDAGEFAKAVSPLEARPFSRAVFVIEYSDVAMLHAVCGAIDAVNTAALGDDIQGSLRSHQLSPEQIAGADGATLNVLCGFQVIDDDCRMIVVEGLVGAIKQLGEDVPRAEANDGACRILLNGDVAFHERLYTAFNVDLKKVRLRDPLPILTLMPEVYNRTKVSTACFEALHRLQAIRAANRLQELAVQGLFPLVEQLLQVESKYGESISMEDIDGKKVVPKKPRMTTREQKQMEQAEGPPLGGAGAGGAVQPPPPGDQGGDSAGLLATSAERSGSVRRKAPTDSTNPAFEASMRAYVVPDFLSAQQEELERTLVAFEGLKASKAEARASDPVPAKFCYSGQKLQYTELKKGELRAKLGREKDTHFTYSKGYLAAAVSMVDETRLALDQALESKAQWKTKRGFVYPAPRQVAEFAKHDRKPSDSRIDALMEPWVENEMHPLPVARSGGLAEGQVDFNTIPAQGKDPFGGMHAPKYERPFDNSNIGSERRLPRGRLTLEKNGDYFRSVHLSGVAGAEEKRRDKQAAEEAWQAKVVVDSLDFKVGGFNTRDRPLQIARADDILKGPAQAKYIKMVRNAHLPSGKKVPLRAPPINMFALEEYVDPKDFTEDLRPDDYETFLAHDRTTGKPLNFVTAIHRELMYPKSQVIMSHTAIPPMASSEKAGQRWARQSAE